MGIYVTSYCNKAHRLSDGKPVEHECYVLPPAALDCERAGSTEQAIELIQAAKPLHVHGGVWPHTGAFDRFVAEQRKSPTFATEYERAGAEIRATDEAVRAAEAQRVTVTLTFDEGDAQAVAELTGGTDLGTLLRDALGEFIARRQPADDYVAERYPAHRPAFRRYKTREVSKRCQLAEVIKRGDVTIEIGGAS